jgi:hypothetical protein
VVEDSKLSVLARNFFSNTDNRSGAADPNYTREWGQGFIANFQSSFNQRTVDLGVAAIGMFRGPAGLRQGAAL